MDCIDGFWLPKSVRDRVLRPGLEFRTLSFARGRPCAQGDDGAVTVRWPAFPEATWKQLLAALSANRQRAPQGQAFWDRLQAAMQALVHQFSDPVNALPFQALRALSSYTGYSQAMIGMTLGALDMWNLDQFPQALRLAPTLDAASHWQPMGELPGRMHFFDARRRPRLLNAVLGRGKQPLFGSPVLPDLVAGYGAGNVPGTALLIAFLALATTLAGGPPPAVVVRNSRREPIFTPLILSALEAVDPGLFATTAILIWDYEDMAVQPQVLTQADLVIAAASDDTIVQIDDSLRRVASSARFHTHGHKVSFSAIGRQVLTGGLSNPTDGALVIDIVALLAALDSVYWDQNGCLSSRVHFVETAGADGHSPLDYAGRLVKQLQVIASVLPRGAWPRQTLHDRFDQYKSMEQTGQVHVLTGYDDEYLVVVDSRPLDATGFQRVVNQCQGRVIVVRPVGDLMEVPDRYLSWLPAANLQSLSVALGQKGDGLTNRFLSFAQACGARGVTAIRTVGRGAFPQLAFSWDGFIPLDLVRRRPEGHFTTIEFDDPYDEMLRTYDLMLRRGMALGWMG